ncbi:class I SAM-dependent methyltransferase [Candidatus Woesebacteria bacterium]|nr:class I SAM-dependent methyltransferase [Candidatus Woesebacteria bacterium]
MKQQAIYRDLAKYYNLIYSFKNYEAESEKIKELIAKHCKSTGTALLEAGCGTGKHAALLNKDFDVVATDINEGMLNVARSHFPSLDIRQADMSQLNFEQEFDVIISLYSSIAYVKTQVKLKKTLQGFFKHLEVGGLVIFEPWFTKETYTVGVPSVKTYESEDTKIVRACVPKIINGVSIMDLNYLIAEKNQEVQHVIDRHEMGLFEIEDTLQLMKDIGFKAKVPQKRFNEKPWIVYRR